MNKKRKLRRKKNVNDYNPNSVEILQAVEYFLNSGGKIKRLFANNKRGSEIPMGSNSALSATVDISDAATITVKSTKGIY